MKEGTGSEPTGPAKLMSSVLELARSAGRKCEEVDVLDKARRTTESRDPQLYFLRVPTARLREVAHDASTSANGAMISVSARDNLGGRAEVLRYRMPVGRGAVSIDCCGASLLLSLEAGRYFLSSMELWDACSCTSAIPVSARCPMREGLKIPRYRVPSAWADLTWPDLLKSPANDMCFRVWDEDFFYTFLTISHYPGDSLMVRPPLRKSWVRLRTAPHTDNSTRCFAIGFLQNEPRGDHSFSSPFCIQLKWFRKPC